MTKAALKLPPLAPFIMDDDQATPAATERALREGLRAARMKGDKAEEARIKGHFNDSESQISDGGPTGLRYAHRPRKVDPIHELIADRRLRHAADCLRRCMEAISTGKPVSLEPFKTPPDPKETPEDKLPPIKNPPAVPDPKNRWVKAKRTMTRTKDGRDIKLDCPPTWPPKPVKRVRGMPKQFIAESVFRAIQWKREGDNRTKLWRICLDSFATWEMREAIWGIIIERRSLTWACKHTDLAPNGRHKRIIKLNLVAALDRVALHLEEGA